MNHINDMFRPIFDIGNAFISDFRAEQAGFYRYQMGLINNVDIVGADNVSQFFGRLYAAFGSSAERNVLASKAFFGFEAPSSMQTRISFSFSTGYAGGI